MINNQNSPVVQVKPPASKEGLIEWINRAFKQITNTIYTAHYLVLVDEKNILHI